MEPIYCPTHGKLHNARQQLAICICGSATPTFGNKGDERASCCSKCKKETMIDLRDNKCKECTKRASYGLEGGKKLYCTEHKKEKMIDLSNPRCKEPDCKITATFGSEEKKPLYCFEHKKEGMFDVKGLKCKEKDCKVRPTYGTIWMKPLYCKEHTKEGLINVVTKRCKVKDCDKIPTYGLEKGKAVVCFEHKEEGMFDVKHDTCAIKDCNTRPSFGLSGKKPTHCADHKLEGMIDVVSSICSTPECKTRPSYADPSNPSKLYCITHKTDKMIDIKHKKCKECLTRANFGFKGKEKEYCSAHKKEGMVDLANKFCEEKDCIKLPSFGYDKKRLRCAEHKLADMKDIAHDSCQFEDCPIQPTFGKEGGSATHCASHKDADMIDVIKDTCPGVEGLKGPDGLCPFGTKGTKKYDMYCMKCFVQGFPDDPRTALARKNTHELAVRDYLNKEFPELKLVHDKPLWTSNCDCTHRRRVDLRTIIGATMLAIEVDENQHTSKDDKDEEIRYDDLYMLHSGKWVYIRYNPDSFTDEKGKRRNPPKEKRLEQLKETIQTLVKKIQEEKNIDLVEIHKLFYNSTISNTLSII